MVVWDSGYLINDGWNPWGWIVRHELEAVGSQM